MSELNGNEKHADLPKPLPAKANRPGTIRNGDLMLYGADTLVVFLPDVSIVVLAGEARWQAGGLAGACHNRAVRRAVRRKLACDRSMARIFITGSTDGLGRAAAQALIQERHQVVLHARSVERAAALDDLAPRSAGVVIGDLSRATDTRNVANQVNALGRMDTVSHNAGAYLTTGRSPTDPGARAHSVAARE